MDDAEAVRARHVERYGEVCADCGEPWPCRVVQLCDALDVLREENTRLRAALAERGEGWQGSTVDTEVPDATAYKNL